MPRLRKRQEQLLQHAQEFITNGQANADVAAAMAAYDYDDDARWAEGQALLDAARQKADANQVAFAAQLGATDALNAAFDQAWGSAQALARLCAVLFAGQTEILELLGLHKRRDASSGESQVAWPRTRNLPRFLVWASNLYAVALTNSVVAAMLADYGYPAERLSREAAEVEAVAQANNVQEIAKAEAQQSTVERDEAMEALKDWFSKAKLVAKLALKDKRQLLEMMGLRVRR